LSKTPFPPAPYDETEDQTGFDIKERTRAKKPRLYKVLLHNDDYTTQDFVVRVLMDVFHKPRPEATQIMLSVHLKGMGVCGVYPHEVAETKVSQVVERARSEGMPLLCTLEVE
jgi:ATP-dependent Clp protease adaptor protein ClpS